MYESINIDVQRKLHADSTSKTPFAHQTEAFAALNQVFQIGKKKSASGFPLGQVRHLPQCGGCAIMYSLKKSKFSG